MRMKASALAHPNIALVKYWGKRDTVLNLPHQPSLSVTLEPLAVRATVQFGVAATSVVINGQPAGADEARRLLAFLDLLGAAGGARGPVRVQTHGEFPVAAGLASSAAAYAALAKAATLAAGLADDGRALSILARQGSGSACRSIDGGVCIWRRGVLADGSDSYAEQLVDQHHWPALRMIAAVVDRRHKRVSSRAGMRRSVESSPYFDAWCHDADAELSRARQFVLRRDLEALGTLSERNAMRMHAVAMSADPPLCYLEGATLDLIRRVEQARASGLPVWYTLDAGPNPVLLTDADHEAQVCALLADAAVPQVVTCRPGAGARSISEHLF